MHVGAIFTESGGLEIFTGDSENDVQEQICTHVNDALLDEFDPSVGVSLLRYMLDKQYGHAITYLQRQEQVTFHVELQEAA